MMKETRQGTYIYGDESYAFEFVTELSMSDKLVFVNSVVDTVVDEDYYNSIIRDLMFDYMVVKVFTNVDTSFLTTIDEDGNTITDIDLLEDFLLETNIVDIVRANASFTLFDELNNAVDKSIQYKTGIQPNPLNNALSNLLSTLERKLDTFDMDKAMEMANKFSGMTEDFTPENIVKAYLETDTHKENLEEIAKAKPKTKRKTKAKSKTKKETNVEVVTDNVIEIASKE